ISDFMTPPPGFVGGQNAVTEWPPYLALSKIFGLPVDRRSGPFSGEPNVWRYQLGGSQLCQSKIDCVVYPNRPTVGERIAFRIHTEYFHNFVDAEKQAYDLLQAWNLSEYNRVVDIYDYEYMTDATGQAIIILLKAAMAGETYS